MIKNLFHRKITILLVEDDGDLRLLLSLYLEHNDKFKVILAENGTQGLKLAREKQPDLILLDWMMPDTSGIEVLSTLKGDKATASIPVVMQTSKGQMADIEKALSLGAANYITKPVTLDALNQKIESTLKQTAS